MQEKGHIFIGAVCGICLLTLTAAITKIYRYPVFIKTVYAKTKQTADNLGQKNPNVFSVNSDNGINWTYEYDSVKKLKENAEYIFSGTVKSAKSQVSEECGVYTNYQVSVDKVYQGDLQEGDMIAVWEIGGTILAADYFEEQDEKKVQKANEASVIKKTMKNNPESTYINYQFEGAWNPEEEKQYLWFANKDVFYEKACYVPVNFYQGVYKMEPAAKNPNAFSKDWMLERYVPKNAGTNRFNFSLGYNMNKMSLDDMEMQLEESDSKRI